MAPQDSFIEEEEDVCPLCIEEFDLSDRNFRPCPCGYQNNMNGLCPACRRPYDEKTIEWKVVTQEEVAEFRANIQKNQKKRAQEQRQKEVQKREAEKENRKNLVGVRVVQKNLVYITGLAPTVREDELLKTLRKPEFFGQYGNIQKISISNRKSPDGQHHSLGIYVTFEKPEEATKCIIAVHGSQNGDRILKAQHGTTKYCSAWLKNEKCNNPGCMFLHEQGDEEDSYTRQDLSSMNSIHTQRPLPGGGGGSSRAVSRQHISHPTPPPPASQPMVRTTSRDGSDNGVDSSALPSSANWARNPQRSRRGSYATSGAASSPAISMSLPATTEATQEAIDDADASSAQQPVANKGKQPHGTQAQTSTPSQEKKEQRSSKTTDSALVALLKTLEVCKLPVFTTANASDDTHPPMFDIRGGEKRRAMREDEESRIDQEDQTEAQAPSEGEPETGGSLALGGEPEDRELGRDVHGFDQRQSSTQPPIQRGSTDGLYGAPSSGSGFPQGSSNIGRVMTPQQLASLRLQAGYTDQMPPGISAQNPFQNPGHNRQSSRFSFANDAGNSTTNIKLAANPRIMAQQSSMMPSSFQSQSSNQFYATSMPGPPPGLKSTGTPPSMFGQGFGTGSGFGGAHKDSSGDLLQTLIGRNRGGSTQPQDVGKPPASGLLASLYGNHPGAFQDFGSKQKKKGKKHRHANTSSSGGSGLVDLADPSILQARMQHQSQSNAGVAGQQGLFGGGQSQGICVVAASIPYTGSHYGATPPEGSIFGQNITILSILSNSAFPFIVPLWKTMMEATQPVLTVLQDELLSLDEATSSVDALVSDEPQGVYAGSGFGFDMGMTRSAPPGFAIHPEMVNAPMSAMASPALSQHRQAEAVPTLSTAPPPGLEHGTVTPVQTPRKVTAPGLEATSNSRPSTSEARVSKHMTSQPQFEQQSVSSPLGDEDFPALGSSQSIKARTQSPATPVVPTPKPTPAAKKRANGMVDKAASSHDHPASMVSDSIKNRPSTISIQPPSDKSVASHDLQGTDKPLEDSSTFPPLPTATASFPSPVHRSGTRTLRLMPTPRATESPALPSPVQSVASKAVSISHRPDTPGSEMISDTASIMSASISASRAGSPPPSKVGSAAVRTTTKSQQRKQRKEALKQETRIIAEASKPEPEEHAPVIGRKKKQKKEKPAKATVSREIPTPPTASAPESSKTESEVPVQPESTNAKVVEETDFKSRTMQKRAAKNKEKEMDMEKGQAKPTPTPASPPAVPSKLAEPGNSVPAEPIESSDPADRQQFGPASVFQEIKSSLWTSALDKLLLLRPVSSSSPRADLSQAANGASQSVYCKDYACKCGEIQDDDLTALRAGKPVRKQFHVDGSRMLITPNGDCIRGLTPEQEDAFLDLQAAIASTADNPGAFVAPRHQPGSGAFSLIKGRAVPNGRPNIFPATAQPQSQDPIGKLQREDALSYINQYVLPRLNLDAANMGFPKGASPLRDAAAASLNALAPYFYGPDAAAGVGIYSAPDGARAMQDFSSSGGAPAADASKIGPANGLGGISLMSVEDAEVRLAASRKETEKLERGLNAVIKRNRRLLLGGGN
ncbi:general negative regulator of transcription subunit 4 [Metarhizium acridum CQMa 102]|uniref:General negative regulator of transcription subunit 4 n=1 Tax=Metarhizium acridum (strain CQMa 102) TaxID=655827 RepID=E9E0I7_METAQ|nr:general negative regulator of transcription subunit 4 [Metarhizium acridum CQMa 102]EFY90607.1 general negative regulator of transcription subunit 4 [Metarhizium acridum CQMa 102]